MIGIIARTSRIEGELAEKSPGIFDLHFASIFDSATESGLAFPKERLVQLLKYPREDQERLPPRDVFRSRLCRWWISRYLEEWDFILEVLARRSRRRGTACAKNSFFCDFAD